MSEKKKRFINPEEKVSILRRHLLEKVPVSELCDEYGIQPTQFYQWQKQFFERGADVFRQHNEGRRDKAHERKIERLEKKLSEKDHIIAVVTEEYVMLKKNLGEP
jgi:transposase